MRSLSVPAIILLLLIPPAVLKARVPHVAVVETMTAPIVQQFTSAFLEAIGDSGKQPVRITRRNAGGDMASAVNQMEEILRTDSPDVVVSVATLASKAVKQVLAGRAIPQVFMCVTDPVGAGLVETVGVPSGKHITGKVHYVPADTKIHLVLKIIRSKQGTGPCRFGYIHTDYPADLSDLKRLTAVADGLPDIRFISREIAYRPVAEHRQELLAEVRDIAKEMAPAVDFFWSPRGVLAVLSEYDRILLTDLPLVVGATEESVQNGALLHVTGDPVSQGRDTAAICRAILKGTAAGDIPTTLPRRIQFAVNLNTAARLKWTIPSDILEMAKGRIYN